MTPEEYLLLSGSDPAGFRAIAASEISNIRMEMDRLRERERKLKTWIDASDDRILAQKKVFREAAAAKTAAVAAAAKQSAFLESLPRLRMGYFDPSRFRYVDLRKHRLSIDHRYIVDLEWEGYRAIWNGTHLYAKNLSFKVKPPAFWTARLPRHVVLEGELCIKNKDGVSDTLHTKMLFQFYQEEQDNRQNDIWKRAAYMVYDIVGGEVRKLPLMERRRLLDKMTTLPPDNPFYIESSTKNTPLRVAPIRPFAPPFDQRIRAFRETYGATYRGIVIKRADSRYDGSAEWIPYKFRDDIDCRVTENNLFVNSPDRTTVLSAVEVEHPVTGDKFVVSASDHDLLEEMIPNYSIVNISFVPDAGQFMKEARLRYIWPPQKSWEDIKRVERAKVAV